VETVTIGDWTVNVRKPKEAGNGGIVLLLHGLTGDEKSMWAFQKLLPGDALAIAPRAPHESQGVNLEGYSWVERPMDFLPTERDFAPAVYQLHSFLDHIVENFPGTDRENLRVVGFSQGAAMAVAYAVTFPTEISKLAVLAGFMPDQIGDFSKNTASYSVFIGHGSEDDVVPVANAEKTKTFFEMGGLHVTYCIAPAGHRLGSDCAVGLKTFLTD